MKSLKRRSILSGVIPILTVLFLFSNLSAGPKVIKSDERGFLGVHVEKMSGDDRDEFGVKFGVLVVKVVDGESAQKAGIKKYDVIQFFNGVKIRRPDDLTVEVRKVKPGTRVKLLVVREGKEKNFTVELGKLKTREFTFKKPEIFKKDIVKIIGGGAHLGVRIQTMNSDLASYFGIKKDEGVLVLNVDKDSPAEKAGIKSGDVIISVGKEKIKNGEVLVKVIHEYKPGDKVKIVVIRHKKQMPILAVLGKGFTGKFFDMDFTPSGEFHFKVPDIDRENIMILREKEGRELKKHLSEMKERMKEEKVRMKEELLRVKENIFRQKEAKEKQLKKLKKLKELKRVREYIYI